LTKDKRKMTIAKRHMTKDKKRHKTFEIRHLTKTEGKAHMTTDKRKKTTTETRQ